VVCLGVFFAVGDPIGDPFHLDRSVMWSYYAAPLCVAAGLVVYARLRLSAWLLNTLLVGLVKFALTYVFATALWAAAAPGPAGPWVAQPRDPGAAPSARVLRPPTPTVLSEGDTTTLRGVVRDATGAPAPGALVWVHEGLDAFVFAPPVEPLRLGVTHDHGAPVGVLQTYQHVEFVTDGAALHSVRARGREGVIFHKAVLTGGSPAAAVFERPQGWLDVRCAVHANAAVARLLTLDHPAWAWTDGDGRFEMAGVPRVPVQLRAWSVRSPALRVVRQGTVAKPGVPALAGPAGAGPAL